MKRLTALFGLGLLAAVAAGQEPKKQPAAATDGERLQGPWVVESVRVNGRDDLAENHVWVGERFVFDGDQARFAFLPGRRGTFQLKGDPTPRHMDFQLPKIKSEDGKSPGVLRAIYKFDGDRLLLSLGVTNEEDRPAGFEPSKTGPPFLHVKLRRPVQPPKPNPGD